MPKQPGSVMMVGDKEEFRRKARKWTRTSYLGIIQPPAKMSASRRQKEKVVWAILNISPNSTAVVKVDNFRLMLPDGTWELLDWHPKEETVDAGEIGKIQDNVPSIARVGCYHYDILINGSLVRDPELQIEN